MHTMNEGKKADGGKPTYELIPAHMEQEVAKVLEFGARKYGPDNWRLVPDATCRDFKILIDLEKIFAI